MPIDGIFCIGLPNVSFIGEVANTAVMPFYWAAYYGGKLPSLAYGFYFRPGRIYGVELTLGSIDNTKYEGH
jgi:hypothetical protein